MDQNKFVSKNEVLEYTTLFSGVFSEIQKVLKKEKKLTFSYRLVGSAKRKLIIRHHNQGFDCDYQLYLQKNKNNMDPKAIKDALINEFNKRMPSYGFETCVNKKKAIEIRKKTTDQDKLVFKYDIVIMKEEGCPQIIHRSENNKFVWNQQADYSTWTEDYRKIKGANMWGELRDLYYDKKIQKDNGTNYKDRKSFQILHEAVKEILSRYGR